VQHRASGATCGSEDYLNRFHWIPKMQKGRENTIRSRFVTAMALLFSRFSDIMKLLFCDIEGAEGVDGETRAEWLQRLVDRSLAVVLTNEEALNYPGFHFWTHSCPELPDGASLICWERATATGLVKFCPFCGARLGPFKLPFEEWIETDVAVMIALAWLGPQGKLLAEWLAAKPHNRTAASERLGPLLTAAAQKLEAIAERRCRRQERRLWAARQRLKAAHQARALVAYARELEARRSDGGLLEIGEPLPNGFVYAISNGLQIKIGWSKHHPNRVKGRLQALQTASPRRLVVLGAFAGTMDDEAFILDLFRFHHVRGEWFRNVPEIRAYFLTRAAHDHQATLETPSESFFFSCA